MELLQGFLPDADPTHLGVVTDCENLLPSELGMKSGPAAVSVGLPAVATEVRGAILHRRMASISKRVVVGAVDGIYATDGGNTWTKVSPNLSLFTDDQWSFCQFGDSIIAAAKSLTIHRGLGTNQFAAISGAPKAHVVLAQKGFVIAFNTNEATYGESVDRWWCSALLDETSWVPSVSTQATTGRLVESPGPLIAAARMGDDIVVYKRGAMWLGRYVGAPEVWAFQQISAEVGCIGQHAVVDTGNANYFVGGDDIYMFDGTQPRSIAAGKVRRWYVNTRDPLNAHKTMLSWDRERSLVWIWFASTRGNGVVDTGLVYNTLTGQWGRYDTTVQAVVAYHQPTVAYEPGPSQVDTYDNSPVVSYESSFWIEGQEALAVIDKDRVLRQFTGVAGTASFTTGVHGDEEMFTTCTRLRLRFKQAPAGASVEGFTRNDMGERARTGSNSIRDDGVFDMRQTGRFHTFKVKLSGDCEVMSIGMTLKPSGVR